MDRYGIKIDCRHCEFAEQNNPDQFDVEVPIEDRESSVVGNAKLICTVKDEEHIIELSEWENDSGKIVPTEDQEQRLLQTLDLFASKKICGNKRICPSEVIDIVDKCNKK